MKTGWRILSWASILEFVPGAIDKARTRNAMNCQPKDAAMYILYTKDLGECLSRENSEMHCWRIMAVLYILDACLKVGQRHCILVGDSRHQRGARQLVRMPMRLLTCAAAIILDHATAAFPACYTGQKRWNLNRNRFSRILISCLVSND